MTRLWVQEAAERFWHTAGGPPEGFPRELRRPIAWSVPLSIVDLPELGMTAMASWLEERCNVSWRPLTDRPLRGALWAGPTGGFVFLNGGDPDDERRFSLAHELAHYIIEYVERRRRIAVRLGTAGLKAMDGQSPRLDETRIDAALARIDLRPRLHLLERDAFNGQPLSLRTTDAEGGADELAIELLAPCEAAVSLGKSVKRAELDGWLALTFGLPRTVARRYAEKLRPQPSGLVRELRQELFRPTTK
jgi:hypothetical protein